ncbi:hypothetical protein LCGC14_1446710 [marine sediment metagenome]|uniref:Flagellar protein FliS n=1 Tax=marine sediment metagenome TaxID=412755 RepID=A0A0F9LZI9_9ZZZZ
MRTVSFREAYHGLLCELMEAGEEVAHNLRRLYTFMNRHLSQANARQDPQMIHDVVACLEDLNEGWKAITS